MRGEKRQGHTRADHAEGSPPHARGKAGTKHAKREIVGITPACAGKSAVPQWFPCSARDHPRMRGEKARKSFKSCLMMGSPPHARGKDHEIHQAAIVRGITPACAGKSSMCLGGKSCVWDHPRMRGEKTIYRSASPALWGSPPHARGKELQSWINGS